MKTDFITVSVNIIIVTPDSSNSKRNEKNTRSTAVAFAKKDKKQQKKDKCLVEICPNTFSFNGALSGFTVKQWFSFTLITTVEYNKDTPIKDQSSEMA